MRFSLLLLLALVPACFFGQDFDQEINRFEEKIVAFRDSIEQLKKEQTALKFERTIKGLRDLGWPGESSEPVIHKAMVLSYNEDYELANWVMHEISRDIIDGSVSRTNDFRTDPMVKTGTAEDADYFIHSVDEDGKDEYDGFGYDRGHLAPSADFRWNETALSESYFYSNMTPQRPEFNRESWVNLESALRDYVINNEVNLFVVTGPVLSPNMPRMERSINNMAIPEYHFKVALDTTNRREIAFLMPNRNCPKPLEAYAVSVDSVEALTQLDFFNQYQYPGSDKLESEVNATPWLAENDKKVAKILDPNKLGKDRYNTIQAYDFMNSNKKVEICGTVVDTHRSKKNNVFLNLDKPFPNSIFSVTIWARDVSNFSYPPEVDLKSKQVCFYGIVKRRNKSLGMNISSEKQVTIIDEDL